MAVTQSDIPGFLQAMGIANTLATYVFGSTLTKVSAWKYRRLASFAIMVSWMAMVVTGVNYIYVKPLFGLDAPFLDAGLALWLASFIILSGVIGKISTSAVNTRVRWRDERKVVFESRFNRPDFGVPLVDDAIRRTCLLGENVHYPFLLVHDQDSPGLDIARRFIAAGIEAGDAVIYFSFSRPASIILEQLRSHATSTDVEADNVYVIDCYSRVYMPEELYGTRTRSNNVLYADPLDPADVYQKYFEALRRARLRAKACRAIYETFSDFLKIADTELVLHYLRRTVVYEERKGIKALYLFWSGALSGDMTEAYASWFFNTTVKVEALRSNVTDAKYRFTIERLFPDHVRVMTDGELEKIILFETNAGRIATFARLLRNLKYQPRPYGFLPALRGSADYAMHVANFAFFMAAVDHNTHSTAIRYDGTVAGTFYHGSDLLYKLADAAKSNDPELFLAPRMATITDAEVATILRTSDGVVPADVAGRAEIFRECATFLRKEYRGDVRNLVDASNHMISGLNGLMDRLDKLAAFADPVAKKSNLFCKLLLRENLFAPTDRDQIEISVDHVLMTMALRSGMVTAAADDEALEARIVAGNVLDAYTVAVLRDATKSVFHDIVRLSGAHADEVDDVIWSYGRKCLRGDTPLPNPDSVSSELDAQIDQHAKTAFIEFMNGLDNGAALHPWRNIRTVAFPFTRFY